MTMFRSGSMSGPFLLFVTLTLHGQILNDGFTVPMSRDAAAECCRVHGSVPPLPMPLTPGNNNLLHDRLLLVNLTVTWLGLRRKILNKFNWLNGTVDEFHGNTVDQRCIAVNVTSKLKRADFCNTEAYGYICERKDCDGCADLGVWKEYCVKDRRSCYIILCETETWFNARSRCIEKGWDPATTVNMPAFRGPSRCLWYWIGLRRVKWTLENGTELKFHTNWGVGQPESVGNCVEFKLLPNARYEWSVDICSEEKSFICHAFNESCALRTIRPMVTSEVFETTIGIEETTEKRSLLKGNLLLPILVSCLVALTFIAGVTYIWKKKQRKNTAESGIKGEGPIEENGELDCAKHLLGKEENIGQEPEQECSRPVKENTEGRKYHIYLLAETPDPLQNEELRQNAHSIRSPLNTLAAFSPYLKKDGFPSKEQLRESNNEEEIWHLGTLDATELEKAITQLKY